MQFIIHDSTRVCFFFFTKLVISIHITPTLSIQNLLNMKEFFYFYFIILVVLI